MVTEYGMSERLGLVSYERPRQSMFLPEGFSSSKKFSEDKAAQIDEEVARFVEEAHQRVRKILSERRDVLNDLAHLLSERESVQGEELRKMLSAATSEMAILSPKQATRNDAGRSDDGKVDILGITEQSIKIPVAEMRESPLGKTKSRKFGGSLWQ